MEDKLDKFLGIEGSREQIPDGIAQKLKKLQLRHSIPGQKDRDIWQNILRETSSAGSKPPLPGLDSIIVLLFRQRKMLFAGIGFIVFLFAGLFLLLRAPQISGVTVASLKGNILINGESFLEEAHLKGNETLETPGETSAKLVLGESNVIFLDSGTKISLEMSRKSFRFSRKVFTMKLIRGRIGAVLNDKKMFSGFRITAPLAVVEVKGTSFFMNVSVENSNYICICNGSLEYYTSTDAQPKSLASGHHKGLEFILEGNTVKVSAGTLKYHDDRYMDYIAGLINEKIPWGE